MTTATRPGSKALAVRQEEGVHLSPLLMLQNAINQDFERFLSHFGVSPGGSRDMPFGGFFPGMNVTEKEGMLRVEAELPGLTGKDITVKLQEHVLTIEGERKQGRAKKRQRAYRREIAYGSFRRSISILGKVDAARARARFKNGILTVDLPLLEKESVPAMRIPIAMGDPGA